MLKEVSSPFEKKDIMFHSVTFSPEQYLDNDFSNLSITFPDKLQRAVNKRRAEFLAGRYCAAKAIQGLGGVWCDNIPVGEKREPVWPEGFLGSITHCHQFASAAVAKEATVQGVGIDSERIVSEKTENNIKDHLATKEELAIDAGGHDPEFLLTLIFSGKEALYKCLFPLGRQMFYFKDARFESIDWDRQVFGIRVLKDIGFQGSKGLLLEGQFNHEADRIDSIIILE